MEYEYAFGWTDARLMQVYAQIGDSEKADRYFRSAVTNLEVVLARHGGQRETMTREQLEKKLKTADDFRFFRHLLGVFHWAG